MQLVRHRSLRNPPIAFAHRGASAHAPENTIAAFELAIDLGATGIESDVWITRDGALVLDHDGVIRCGLRKRRYADLDRSDLPITVPTLGELWDRCGTDIEISLDVKDDKAAAPLLDAITERGVADRTWLCHPDLDVLTRWRVVSDDIKLVHSTRIDRLAKGPERHIAGLASTGVDVINMPGHEWSGGLMALAHRFERLAFAWDAQTERVLRDLVWMGADGVYSDHVDRMVGVIAAEAGR